jgi:hypothetical protein
MRTGTLPHMRISASTVRFSRYVRPPGEQTVIVTRSSETRETDANRQSERDRTTSREPMTREARDMGEMLRSDAVMMD